MSAVDLSSRLAKLYAALSSQSKSYDAEAVAEAVERLNALQQRLAEVEGALRFAVENLAGDTFVGDTVDEFYEKARSALSTEKAQG